MSYGMDKLLLKSDHNLGPNQMVLFNAHAYQVSSHSALRWPSYAPKIIRLEIADNYAGLDLVLLILY